MSYRKYEPEGPLLIGYDPDQVLAGDHLARFVDRVVEECVEVAERKRRVGNSPYNPKLLVKVLLYGYATGLRSSRQLEKHCEEHLAYRLLTRGETPSYRTLCTGRIELKDDVELCWQGMFAVAESAGVKRLGRIDLDSTKVKADAGPESVVKRDDFEPFAAKIRQILDEAERQDAAEDAEGYSGSTLVGKTVGGDQMREVLRRVRKAVRAEREGAAEASCEPLALGPKMLPRLEAAIQTLEAAAEGGRKHASLTDPDARMMAEGRNKRIGECHSLDVAADNGLLVCAQSSQTATDNSLLPVLTEGAKRNEPGGVTHVTADSGFFGTDNVLALEDAGIDTCVPNVDTARALRKGAAARAAEGGAAAMRHDEAADCYWCAQGKKLAFVQVRKQNGQTLAVYRAESDCTDCPVKSACMSNANAKRRMLKVGVQEPRIKDLLRRFEEPEHKERYHQRGKNVETVFAFIRTVLKFNRWSLRGKDKVDAERALVAAGYQVRKVHTAVRRTAGAPA